MAHLIKVALLAKWGLQIILVFVGSTKLAKLAIDPEKTPMQNYKTQEWLH